MPCKICGKDAESEFCELHRKAYENLQDKFVDWKKSLDISWPQYLKEILRNPYAGLWVKEVAQYLLGSSSTEQS